MTHKFIRTLLPTIFLLGIAIIPQTAQAAETFSPTVKIISYSQYLNGTIGAEGTGSGTIINNAGLILTNAHVVYDDAFGEPYDAFVVCVSEDSQSEPDCRFTATLKRYDERIDLALLSIDATTAWGSKPSTFPYLNYQGKDVVEGDEVTVLGFPANGGLRISTTKGQVSGYDEVDGYEYLKTDADIDAGNSGGTLLDSEGNFAGIPSYLVSYYENSGRALKISEAAAWIDSTRGEKGSINTDARERARSEWRRFHETDTSGTFTMEKDPEISLELPHDWQVFSVAENGISINKEDNQIARFTMIVSSNLFDLNMTSEQRQEALDKIFGEDSYQKSEFITVSGEKALHLYDEGPNGSSHLVSFARGYKDILITYNIPDNEKEVVTEDIQLILDSVSFGMASIDDPNPTRRLDEPGVPFTVEVPSPWRITTDDVVGSTIAIGGRNTQLVEGLKIYYSDFPGNEVDYTMEEGLEYDIEHYVPEDGDVTFQSDELMLDGLPGWIYIYEDDPEDIEMKYASVTVVDPHMEIYLDFKAEASEFDAQLPNFIETLKSFESKRYDNWDDDWDELFDPAEEGNYNVPHPGNDDSGLSDINGHRYEESIKSLVDMEVIGGYPDGSFKPENPVNRAEALKIILQSLRARQEEEGEALFQMPENFNKFADLSPSEWYATYVAEGVDKGIINGYPDGTFKGGNTVNLAEALKMVLIAHGATIWEGETDPWHKKYFDAAYALDLLPKGLTDPGKLLTRAELAYIVDQMTSE